jgi:hypothetical protein
MISPRWWVARCPKGASTPGRRRRRPGPRPGRSVHAAPKKTLDRHIVPLPAVHALRTRGRGGEATQSGGKLVRHRSGPGRWGSWLLAATERHVDFDRALRAGSAARTLQPSCEPQRGRRPSASQERPRALPSRRAGARAEDRAGLRRTLGLTRTGTDSRCPPAPTHLLCSPGDARGARAIQALAGRMDLAVDAGSPSPRSPW